MSATASTNHHQIDAFDYDMMNLALAEARKCEPKSTAFSVGCVLVIRPIKDAQPTILTTGYSRELEGNTHAEVNALQKARRLTKDQISTLALPASIHDNTHEHPSINALLRISEVYTTMEPCSMRTSGLAPCADALIDAGVSRCVIGVGEPDDFVQCEGAKKLMDAGIMVVWLKGMEYECLEVARMGNP